MSLKKAKPNQRYLLQTQVDPRTKEYSQHIFVFTETLAKKTDMREVSPEEADIVLTGGKLPRVMSPAMPGYTGMQIPDEAKDEVQRILEKYGPKPAGSEKATGSFPEVEYVDKTSPAPKEMAPKGPPVEPAVDPTKAPKEDFGPDNPDGERDRPLEVVKVEKMRSKNEVEEVAESLGVELDRRMSLENMKAAVIEKMTAK